MNDMDSPVFLSNEQRAELVAYLDGELDESASAEIERLIASDERVRHEADLLTRSFELLEVLPRERASDTFTVQTMATVRVSDAQTRQHDERRRTRWLSRKAAAYGGWAAGVALALVAGFLVTSRWIPDESRLLIEDLPVIQNLDMYTEVESVDFLRELQQSGLFDEPVDGNL